VLTAPGVTGNVHGSTLLRLNSLAGVFRIFVRRSYLRSRMASLPSLSSRILNPSQVIP